MTRKTRRRIFYALLATFFIVGGGVVFYADGWRLDFQRWHLTKIGGIYIRAFPENASLYLDGKPTQNQSGFLTQGTLISDLLPGTYSVTIKAAGYDDWQENAGVLPSQVVQFKYAVLVPQDSIPVASGTVTTPPKNASSSISTSTAADVATLPGKNIEVKQVNAGVIGILQNDGSLYLYDMNAKTFRKLAETVKDFSVTEDGSMVAALEHASLEIFSLSGENNYYRFNLPDVADAQNVLWYKDRTHLFIVYPNHVSFLDLADSGLTNFTTVGDGISPFYDLQSNSLFMTNPANKPVRFDFPS